MTHGIVHFPSQWWGANIIGFVNGENEGGVGLEAKYESTLEGSSGLTVTARWGGTRGNSLRAAVQANADDEEKVDVVTYLEEQEVDRQTVAASGGAADWHYILWLLRQYGLELLFAVLLSTPVFGKLSAPSRTGLPHKSFTPSGSFWCSSSLC